MANVKAYIPVEYIGEKRKMGDSKSITRGYGTWFFCEKNNWTVKCPSDVADWCSRYPALFKVHWDDDDKVAMLEAKVELLEKKLEKQSSTKTKKE